MISLQSVSVRVPVPRAPGQGWGTRTLLDDITLDLGERRVAFVGANGSGKSTLLRLLNGLVLASSGRVTVDGLDPATDGKSVRRRVGFVFTDPLSQLVMPTPLEDVDLSGGERQLVALTAVLAVEPAVLVADEPTTLLDLRNRLALRRVVAELDQRVVLATHDLDLARDADRVLVVDEGRIVADGAPAEAIAHYERMMA
jgi:biotin transport system ATP-binding protein